MSLFRTISLRGGRSVAVSGLVVGLCAGLLGGCAQTGPQVTHHWVSQDKVAGNTYRSDVAACSQGGAELSANSAAFTAYQSCMKERGYALVAANDLEKVSSEQPVNTRY